MPAAAFLFCVNAMQNLKSKELLDIIHPLKTAKNGHLLLDIVYILGADLRFFEVRNQRT